LLCEIGVRGAKKIASNQEGNEKLRKAGTVGDMTDRDKLHRRDLLEEYFYRTQVSFLFGKRYLAPYIALLFSKGLRKVSSPAIRNV